MADRKPTRAELEPELLVKGPATVTGVRVYWPTAGSPLRATLWDQASGTRLASAEGVTGDAATVVVFEPSVALRLGQLAKLHVISADDDRVQTKEILYTGGTLTAGSPRPTRSMWEVFEEVGWWPTEPIVGGD